MTLRYRLLQVLRSCQCWSVRYQIYSLICSFKSSGWKKADKYSPTIAYTCTTFPHAVSALQHTVRGDDTIQEALYHLRDLTGYSHVLTFDLNVIYIPNSRIQSKEMCRCKEFIAQELLRTLLSVETTDQDAASALRLLQHNIRFLLQYSLGDQCLQDEVMVPMKNMSIDRQLMFIRLCITFFQNWMYKCISSSDF